MTVIDHKHRAPILRTLIFDNPRGVITYWIVEEWSQQHPKQDAISGPLGEILAKKKYRTQRLMLDIQGRFVLCSTLQGESDYSFPDLEQARSWMKAHSEALARPAARLPKADIQAIAQAAAQAAAQALTESQSN